MDLVLTEEQELLARTARELVSGRSSLRRIRQLRDGNDPDGFSRELWREMAALGWLGITIPEEHGGSGLGCDGADGRARGARPRSHARADALDGPPRRHRAPPRRQRRAEEGASAPRSRRASAFSPSPSRRPRAATTRATSRPSATKAGSGWVLAGEKIQVLDGHVADRLIVSARTAGGTKRRGGHHALPAPSRYARRRDRAAVAHRRPERRARPPRRRAGRPRCRHRCGRRRRPAPRARPRPCRHRPRRRDARHR